MLQLQRVRFRALSTHLPVPKKPSNPLRECVVEASPASQKRHEKRASRTVNALLVGRVKFLGLIQPPHLFTVLAY